MPEADLSVPTSIRRLDTAKSTQLVRLVEAYDELQTVLRCCEQLVALLGKGAQGGDDVGVEALWTLGLLSYARAFADRDGAAALTEADLSAAEPSSKPADGAAEGSGGDAAKPPAPAAAEPAQDAAGHDAIVRAHQLLLHLRDYHSDLGANPRETYTVGVAQDAGGAVNAVAVTSVHAPQVDAVAVRQAGGIAFALCGVLDERIAALQEEILAEVRDTPQAELETLDLIEVAAPA